MIFHSLKNFYLLVIEKLEMRENVLFDKAWRLKMGSHVIKLPELADPVLCFKLPLIVSIQRMLI